jgi:putative MATE family efflux protein
MFNPAKGILQWLGRQLATRGLVDDYRTERIADLTWPRFLTMVARSSLRVADVSMVGLNIGSAAIAGLAFAAVYWQIAVSFGLGIAGGTIGLVSQRFAGGRSDRVDLAIKQSVWLGTAMTVPFVLSYWLYSGELIAALTRDSTITRYGGTYLRLSSVALLFVMFNLISSRALAGADDTWIPMAIRSTGAVTNIVLNAVFIFGMGMSVTGAALGSVIAEGLVSACFVWGFIRGSVPVVGTFPIDISAGPPYFDRTLLWQISQIVPPLIAQKLGKVVVRFPLFALLAVFGPAIVSAFEVGRRVRKLLNAFGAGFSMSASSVVGQELGRGDEGVAMKYARDTVVFSAFVYLLFGTAVFLLAPVVSHLFVSDPRAIERTTPFVRIATVSFVGLGLFRTFGGILKAAGDNRWIMYGRLCGLYLALLPLTYLGSVSGFGVTAVYVALFGETWVAALLTGHRAMSGRWATVNRSFRPSSTSD